MRNIYKIEIRYDNETKAELHFEKQDVAEKFAEVMQDLLNKRGKANVEIEATIIDVYENNEDIASEMIEAIDIVSEFFNDGRDLNSLLKK